MATESMTEIALVTLVGKVTVRAPITLVAIEKDITRRKYAVVEWNGERHKLYIDDTMNLDFKFDITEKIFK